MKIKYVKANKGKQFALSEFGLEKSFVRDKFRQGNPVRDKFMKSVPKTWIEKGYVEEIIL